MKLLVLFVFYVFFLSSCGGKQEKYEWIELDVDAIQFKFKEGLIGVKKSGRWGYVDKKGKLVIPYQFDEAQDFDKGIAFIKHEGILCCINKSGKIISSCKSELPIGSHFSEGLAITRDTMRFFGNITGYLYGYMDKDKRVVVKPIYSEARDFSEGLAWVKNSEKWGCIDKTGETVIPFGFKNAYSFSEGLSAVTSSLIWWGAGYIDRNGNEVIPFDFEVAHSFSEGVAIARKSGKWGILSLKIKNETNAIDHLKKAKFEIDFLKSTKEELENEKKEKQIAIQNFSLDIDKFEKKLTDFRRNNPKITTHNAIIQNTEAKIILQNLAKALTFRGVWERKLTSLNEYLIVLQGKIESNEIELKYLEIEDASKIENLITKIRKIKDEYNKNDFILDTNRVKLISTEEAWNAINQKLSTKNK